VVKLQELRYKRVDNATSVTIPSKSGESHKLFEIFIDSPAADSYFDVVIGTKTVARIPVALGDSLFVAPYSGSVYDFSILEMIRRIYGADVNFEADQDEDISLKFSASQGTVHVFYTVGPVGIDKTKLGRSKCENYILFGLVTHSAAINTTKNYSLDTSLMPLGFPDIKDAFVVPSGRQLVIKALAFGAKAAGSSTPTYLHMYDETYEFFEPIAHTGVSVQVGKNVLVCDVKTQDVFTIEDYIVDSGHKLTLNIDASYDGTNAIAAGSEKLIIIGTWALKA